MIQLSGSSGYLVALLWWLPKGSRPCLEIGQRVDETCIKRVVDPDFLILVNPNQLDTGLAFYYQQIRYTGVVKQGHWTFLSTSDVHFRTPEGVAPRMTLGQLQLRPTQVRLIQGWAQVYYLPSGWCCAFSFKAKLKADSQVLFLYKK